MPWAIRGLGTLAADDNPTSLSPGLPSGWQPGDICFLQTQNNGGTNARTPDTPSGWTPYDGSSGYFSNGDTHHGLWWRIMQSGDSAPTVTFTGTGRVGDTTLASIGGWYHPDPRAVLSVDVVGTASTNALADNIGPISGITPRPNSMLLISCGKSNDWNGNPGLTSWTSAGTSESTLGDDAGCAFLYDFSFTIAATGDLTVNDGGGTASDGLGCGVMLSLRAEYPKLADIRPQPKYIAGLNHAHPLMPYFAGGSAGAEINLIHPRFGWLNLFGNDPRIPPTSAIVWGNRVEGVGADFAADDSYMLRGSISRTTQYGWWLALAISDDLAPGGNGYTMTMLANNTASNPARLGSTFGGASEDWRGDFRNLSGGTSAALYTYRQITPGQLVAFAGINYSQTDHRLFLNGEEFQDTTNLGSSYTTCVYNNVGANYDSTTGINSQINGMVLMKALGPDIATQPPAALLREWTRNPWALFSTGKRLPRWAMGSIVTPPVESMDTTVTRTVEVLMGPPP